MEHSNLVLANWKLQHTNNSAQEWLSTFHERYRPIDDVEVCVAPSFTEIPLVSSYLNSGLVLGAQDVSSFDLGRFTGEVSAKQLSQYQVRYVIIGHSERRLYFKESVEDVNTKVQRVVDADMIPVVAVSTLEQVEGLALVLSSNLSNPVYVAYEPLEAIGSGDPADPHSVADFIAEASKLLPAGVLFMYGGSVDSGNVTEFLTIPQVNGFLVGTASVLVDDFLRLLDTIHQYETNNS